MGTTSRPLARSPGETVRTICVQVSAAVMVGAVAHLMPMLFVPPLLAIVLAMALSPVARWLERRGLPTAASGLICTAIVGAVLTLVVSLVVYEAGTLIRQLLGQLDRISVLLARWLERAGVETAAATPEFWQQTLARTLLGLLDWLPGRLGGLIGAVFGAVVLLVALFMLLHRRDAWVDRGLDAAGRLGLRTDREVLETTRHRVARYLGILSLIASTYVVLITLSFWGLGVPNPLLWGVLSGMLEYVPVLGPLISGSLATLGAMATGTPWKPAAVAGLYLTLHTIEGYVIWPIVFGKTIRSDQVSIFLAVIGFGWLLGPLGPVLGLPLLIILRGLIALTPDTPAMDAIVEATEAVD